ncbi:oxidoreductase [Pseudoxanthomonas sp. PXM02]|uniref:oxidoreductase n=1 Tax=Pseudoxanthomonas sp. PXM02 TaxID=2769294 RepID=UPI001783E5B5|nr:oxidoreductase [Pseudoxanthomonas sp. PXM02]MBD9478790.1 oxidoreductase [Pseudoxanthomonas sp. PXM02]
MDTPLNVALVGYGFVGKVFHAPLIQATPGLRLHTVVSRDAAKVHADWPDTAVTPDAHAAFADPAVDLVVIASPNDSHAPLAIAALNQGKHVVVDKPFTLTLQEAQDVIAASERVGRLVSVFQNRRWDADFLTVQRLIEEGALGRVAEFHSHFDRFRRVVQDRWRERGEPGGGLWYDLGPHLLDQAVHLFGLPQAINADIARLRDGAQAPDYFDVTLRYPGHRAILHASALVAGNGLRFAVHGTRGSYLKHGLDAQEDQLRAGMVPGTPGWGVDPRSGELVQERDGRLVTEVARAEHGDYRAYYAGMRDAILHGGPVPVTPQKALEVMRLIELGARSSEERREIALG